eukprot:10708902-Ditylum_brightwellii.AAC.1
MPSPNVKSILINHVPQIIQYNIHDPPHLTDSTEEDYEDPDNASKDQDQDTPPIQSSGMNINLHLPVINTME